MQPLLLHSLIWRGQKVNYVGKQGQKSIWRCRWHSVFLCRLLMRIMFRPLHGLPVLIKGNIGTKDVMQTNGE